MDIVSGPIGEAFSTVVKVAGKHLAYIASYKKNVDELKDNVGNLENAKQRVQNQVHEAKKKIEVIEADAQSWLDKADNKINDIRTIQGDKRHDKTDCSMGLLPYLWFRHQLGRKAKKMTLDIKSILEEKPDNVSVTKESISIDVALSHSGYESFESRSAVMGNIEAALKDSNVRMIGVVGPGGVGKTTLVKEVAKKAKEDNSFNVVVMVNVTRDPNLTKIQKEIAEMLGSTLEEESEIARAYRLRMILKNEKRNILIILDDLWEGLDLNKLGISFDDDDNFSHMTGGKDKQNSDSNEMKTLEESSSNYKECKILLTSRIKEVLSIQMDGKMETIFRVGLLEENEAKTLFKKLVAKVPEKNSDFEKLMDEIIKKCDCLPMAIIAVGKALRNKSHTEWKEVLERLNRQGFTGVHKSMEFSIKLSYDHIESEELKLTFLLCAQMGPHPLVMDLVKYCVGLGILEGVHTIREGCSRIDRSIKKFKDIGLLLENDSSDYLSMHDTVHDAASSIASKERNMFTLRNGKLDEWLDKHELERCTSIFLHNCDIIDGLPESINCPQLKVFHIDNVDPSIRIPDNFFKEMRKLRVLILNGIHIPHLPSSIKCLTNLRMLCLERCVLGDNLFQIGELKKLRIMSFSGSEINKLPGEIRQLVNLQWLDISNCSKLRMIPPNVVSNFASLEKLYMRNSFIQREVEGEGEIGQSLLIILIELSSLYKLDTLDICISNAEVLPKNLFFNKLDDYKIMIGDFDSLFVRDFKVPDKYETSRTLALQIKEGNDIHSQKGIKILFKRVENLLLGELKGVCDALFELNLEGFSCLKHFFIYENSDIQYIIKPMGIIHPLNVFPKLESLCLYKLKNMEILFNNRLTNGSLNNLKAIKIETCSRLKFLFSFDLVRLLNNLETVKVFDCDSLEEIIAGKIQENAETNVKDDKIEFPQLRSLSLKALLKLTGFYANDESISISQSMERRGPANEFDEITEEEKLSISLFSEQVFIPNIESLKLSSINIHEIWGYQPSSSFCFKKLTKLKVNKCNRLKYLFPFSVAKNLENLKDLYVRDCEMTKGIFYPEEVSMNEAEAIIFPKLENIRLSSMKKLSIIWPSQVCSEGSFCNLNSVVIERCLQVETVFPSHMIGILKNLVSLRVSSCDSVKAIFDLEDTLQTNAEGNETKLQRIFLMFLPNLKLIWSRDPKGILNYKNLQAIKVYKCSVLQHILPVSDAKDIQKLESLEASHCGELEEIVALTEEGLEISSNTFMFPQVTKLLLEELPRLRRHNLEWKALKRMTVRDCEKLEAFTEDNIKFQQVIPNLEYMTIGLKEAECLKRCIGNHLMCNLKHLSFYSLNGSDIVYWFLHRTPNLEHLWLQNCEFEELLPCGSLAAQEKIGTVVWLKDLRLINLGDLQNIGLERDPILQRVESLTIWNCPRLIELASPSVSFTHLTCLEVFSCHRLMNLMGSSTAKSLVQLTTMNVSFCSAMQEIVAKEGNEEENVVKIVFNKLITLELVELKNLSSFCSSKTLDFNFPSLENLIVRECYKMKMFTKGVTSAPNLQNVRMEDDEDAESYWEGDLNSTIRNLGRNEVAQFARDVGYLDLVEHPELEKIWHGVVPVPDGSFSNLKILKVEGCDFLSHVIPSHLVPFLSKLEYLKVQNCNSVKVIFDVKNTGASPLHLALKNLTLEKLPNLEQIWHGVVLVSERSFSNLKTLEVEGCDFLSHVIPSHLFPFLDKLEELTVRNCGSVKVIFDVKNTGASPLLLALKNLILNELPNLEEIWHGVVPVPGESFSNLETLEVEGCDFLSHVIPSHLLPSLSKLKNLTVENCNSVKVIFDVKNAGDSSLHLALKNLTLEELPNLEEIWHGVVLVSERSFSNLKTLEVKGCDFLTHVIPSHLLPSLSKLKNLRVENCNSVKVIFDVKNAGASSFHLTLKNLTLEELPNLEHVWNKDPHGIVKFQTLVEVYVDGCKGLKSLFPASVAKDLVKLEILNVENCEELVEIVAKDETAEEEGGAQRLMFPCMASLKLQELPELKCFYPGPHELEWPVFENLYIYHCDKLKIFTSEFQTCQESLPENQVEAPFTRQALFSMEKVFPNLKELSLNGKDTMMLSREAMPENLLHNLKLLWLICFHSVGKADRWLFELLHKVPNIEELRVCCSGFKELFPSQALEVECIRVLEQLKQLHLDRLFRLQSIGLEHSWVHPLLQTLENLIVARCPRLTKLVQFAVSFSNLKQLNIFECHGLEYLFTSSTARSLVRLERMYIKKCKSIKEIVAKEGDKSAEDEIIFELLKSLSLRLLPSLVSFYNGNSTLIFQSLETVSIEQCPKMKIFSQGEINAQQLTAIHVSYRRRWKGDLNTTIEELFNEQVPYKYSEDLKLSDYPELEQVWHGELALPEDSFRNLTSLVIENLKFISKAVPSHLLPHLKRLKELQIRNCTSVEVIFDTKGEETIFRLEKLTLDQLPNMKHVWNKDPQEALRFESLQHVHVTNCEGLKALFPESLAKNLVKLKNLRIETCKALEEIVWKEEAASGRTSATTSAKFVFPCLTSVTLTLLPELKWFYYAKHKVRCPILQDLRVYHCCKLKIFTLDPQSYQEAQPADHAHISFQKIFPKVEELSLSEEETMMFSHGDDAENLLNRIIRLQLCCFHNVKEVETLPWGFLQKVPKIETLAVACSDFEELFPSQGVDVDANVMSIFAQLNELKVENLSKLNSIGLEHPWLDTFRENLKILEVSRCPCLTKLIQSPVSCSNLRELLLNKCDGLIYLFTSSIVKNLVSLKRMSIEECESLKQIVATEGDESCEDDLIFEKLRKLSLNSLPCLASFYAGSSVLKFPSLGEVIIAQCPTMKIFSQGLVIAPILIEVQASMNKDDLLWEGDLKTTVEKMFKEKAEQDNNDAIGEGTGEKDCS